MRSRLALLLVLSTVACVRGSIEGPSEEDRPRSFRAPPSRAEHDAQDRGEGLAPAAWSPTTPEGSGHAGKSRILLGYWASWTRAALPPSSVPWSKLTHVAHAFVLPGSTGGLKNASSYVDEELVTTAHAHGVKVVASVGGWGASFDANLDPIARAKTVAALAALCRDHGYDGIDVDWEYPTEKTASAWAALVVELRAALDAIDPELTLSAAISADPAHVSVLPKSGLDRLAFVGVMTYDYAGPWSTRIAHHAPLTSSEGGNVVRSIAHLVSAMSLPSQKVLVGLPFYGYRFGGSSLGGGPVAPSGGLDYREIANMIGTAGWSRVWDATASVPYLTRPSSPGFVTYDDPPSIAAKCTWAASRSLGGAIVWHLAGDRLDDGSHPLLDAAQGCR